MSQSFRGRRLDEIPLETVEREREADSVYRLLLFFIFHKHKLNFEKSTALKALECVILIRLFYTFINICYIHNNDILSLYKWDIVNMLAKSGFFKFEQAP